MNGSFDSPSSSGRIAPDWQQLTPIDRVDRPAAKPSTDDRQPLETFGSGLRLERERRRITLASIAANTKISIRLLEDLERDDVSRWPAGIFRRSFIRAYAQALGLDPDNVVAEFLERFPNPEPAVSSLERPGPAQTGPALHAGAPGLRLTLAAPGAAFTRGCVLEAVRTRAAGVMWDTAAVVAIASTFFAVLGQFWKPLGISALLYHASSIFLLGNTPGVCLFAPVSPTRPVTESPAGESSGGATAGLKGRLAFAYRWLESRWRECSCAHESARLTPKAD